MKIGISILFLIVLSNFVSAQNSDSSVVVLKNEKNLLPLKRLDTLKIGFIRFGKIDTVFAENLRRYTKVKIINARSKEFLKQTDDCNLLISCITNGGDKTLSFVEDLLSSNKKVVLCIVGGEHIVNELGTLKKSTSILYYPNRKGENGDIISQVIFGGFGADGHLKETDGPFFRKNDGIQTIGGLRFQYLPQKKIGLDSAFLHRKIDSVVNAGIKARAMPGCRIFAAINGKVFFDESYGFHTYDSTHKVCKSDLYDLASVTKIAGPLPLIVQAVDSGKLNLDNNMSFYWNKFTGKKEKLTCREILTHQAGLQPWIPFWKALVRKNGKFKHRLVRHEKSKRFPTQIADNLYLKKNYKKRIFKTIDRSLLLPEKKYKYSDLSFYIWPEILSGIFHEDYETALYSRFFDKLGAERMRYNPKRFFPLSEIVPTENDTFFRKQLIHGTVHDEGAALMGGVSGHAGLFADAADLAKLMQMYLNGGTYGGERYFSEKTMKEFTKTQFPENGNRRALGFDKPFLKDRDQGTYAPSASDASFGHTGFTGTFAWVDPENGLLIVFLSNRVYPKRENEKLLQMNIRPTVHEIFYEALKKSKAGKEKGVEK
jgi:CubicO group peptidase (beta-lactamase class C family)